MPERNFNAGTYRNGYQGQEMVNEISGVGNAYTFEYRVQDPRVGRFWTVDPLIQSYPGWSPYGFAQNRVIDGIDFEGLEWQPVNSKGENVPVGSDQIQDYKWLGYEMKDVIPFIDPQPVAPEGTVAKAQINYWVDGVEFSEYFGVSKDRDPINKTYLRAPWLQTARQHIGLTEGGNSTVQGMIDQLNTDFTRSDGKKPIYSDSEPWCGVFVYSCLRESAYPISSNSWETPAINTFYSKNWNEGTAIKTPTYGAIAVMNFGHVAFVHSYNSKYVWILGGNQRTDGAADGNGSEVNIRKYLLTQVNKFILPSDYEKPPLD